MWNDKKIIKKLKMIYFGLLYNKLDNFWIAAIWILLSSFLYQYYLRWEEG